MKTQNQHSDQLHSASQVNLSGFSGWSGVSYDLACEMLKTVQQPAMINGTPRKRMVAYRGKLVHQNSPIRAKGLPVSARVGVSFCAEAA